MSIRFRYVGEGKAQAVGRYDRQQCDAMAFGAILEAEEVKQRSMQFHRFWFATVNDAWETLPDHLQARFPEPEALRKFLLVKAGWCDAREFACDSPEAAATLAAALKWTEPYSAVVVSGNVVLAYVARSQKIKAQDRKSFSQVTERALHHLSEMLGVDPTTLRDSEAA